MSQERVTLIGCGILKKEINFLIQKNNWPWDTYFLDSSLHISFEDLYNDLTAALNKQHLKENSIVFYGACHPKMDQLLENAGTIRTCGQNCIEMILGNEIFTQELSRGAFFLLEDWACRWKYLMEKTFGGNAEVIKEIFKGDRNYLLGINTPCSRDFQREAEKMAEAVELPLRWMDTALGQLEFVLQEALNTKCCKRGRDTNV